MSSFSHTDVANLAFDEMTKWGLIAKGWTFRVNKSIQILGWCSPQDRIIKLSAYHIEHNSNESIMNTIRHEIAHALHFHHYADRGTPNEYSACVMRRGKLVRKIKPHGKEWKKFAIMVGCTPKASAESNVQKNVGYKWNLVTISDGVVTDEHSGFHRFPKKLSNRYMLRDKVGTKGKLYLVSGNDWVSYVKGQLGLGELSFYQDSTTCPALRGLYS